MRIVPKTPDGDLKWDESFEVESLESWADERNQRMTEMGLNHHYWAVSKMEVQYCDGAGKIIRSYHRCEVNPYRLV